MAERSKKEKGVAVSNHRTVGVPRSREKERRRRTHGRRRDVGQRGLYIQVGAGWSHTGGAGRSPGPLSSSLGGEAAGALTA